MQDADYAPRLAQLLDRVAHELSGAERAMAYTALAANDPPNVLAWSQRSIEADPRHDVPEARSAVLNIAAVHALEDPRRALDELAILRTLPDGMGVDSHLLSYVVEARARDLLGDHHGAEQALAVALTDSGSIFAAPVLTVLATRRALDGDIATATTILETVEADPYFRLRTAELSAVAARTYLRIAQGDLATAASHVRHLESLRDQRFTLHPTTEHYWFSAAAHLAAAHHDIDTAAQLTSGALAIRHQEAQTYPLLVLQQRHRHDPRWQHAAALTTSSDELRALARAVGRHE